MKLITKFNIVLIGVFLVGLAITAYFSWRILQVNARNEIVERAGLMMEAALATRGYTVSEVAPLLRPLMTESFHPQTVPAYAATQIFNKLREFHSEYNYKEATLNPTNPRDRATDWESDVVRAFRSNSNLPELIGERDTPTGAALFLARPIKITNPNCLLCHSTPEAAPKPMLAKYGDSNGFGWQLNEIVGAQIVSVPMRVPITHAQRAFTTFMGTLAGVFVIIVLVLNIMLRKIVIYPVTRMASIADDVSKGAQEVPEFEAQGNDEIATLSRSFTRMRRSLEKAISMLRRPGTSTRRS